jgi:hypothetical protein
VSDYGLDDRVNEVRSPAGAKDFSSSLCVQTGSGAHPDSWPMGTGGSFLGGKALPRWWMSKTIYPLPTSASMAYSGTALLFLFYKKAILKAPRRQEEIVDF